MGPLRGIKVIEMGAIGPVPFGATLLADAGADVVRIDRARPASPLGERSRESDPLSRSRRSLALDLKHPDAAGVVLRLVDGADVLVEGFRPGVMERFGLGPDTCLARNPRLVYARMTGWGQTGPLSHAAGHDLNYIALSGALHAIGPAERPLPPLNLVGDFGAGGMMLAFGIAAALLERTRSGQGQVIDAAMCDGAALMMAPFQALRADGLWEDARERNLLDGAAPFYRTYRCSDGHHVSLAALEPRFYGELLHLLEIDPARFPDRGDRSQWPALAAALEQAFGSRTRNEWCALLEGTDACFAPVLSLAEAAAHPHHVARGSFVPVGKTIQAAPAPRFGRTRGETPSPLQQGAPVARSILADAGLDDVSIEALWRSGVLQPVDGMSS